MSTLIDNELADAMAEAMEKTEPRRNDMTATRRAKSARTAEQAIQFKVQLRYIRPPIWRRVVLADNATLGDLHAVIQTAMGWYNCHLHSFRIGGVHYTSRSASQMEDTRPW